MAQRREPTAAEALYGTQRNYYRDEDKRGPRPSVADALWPNRSRAKLQEQQRIDDFRKRDRESLLRHLREANANIDRRMRGGR